MSASLPSTTIDCPSTTVPHVNSEGTELTSSTEAVKVENTKCSRRGCKSPAPTVKCGYFSCKKQIHLACFEDLYIEKGYNKLPPDQVACTKRCYDQLLVQSSRQPGWIKFFSSSFGHLMASERRLWIATTQLFLKKLLVPLPTPNTCRKVGLQAPLPDLPM